MSESSSSGADKEKDPSKLDIPQRPRNEVLQTPAGTGIPRRRTTQRTTSSYASTKPPPPTRWQTYKAKAKAELPTVILMVKNALPPTISLAMYVV